MKLNFQVNNLTEGPIAKQMTLLALPMMVGIAANMSFNLIDTYFIGQLGGVQLTAISFSFPVILTVLNLSIGLAIGANAVLSRLLGEGEDQKVRSLSTGLFMFSVCLSLLVTVVGIFTIRPLFIMIGASEREIGFISSYMSFAYIAMGLRLVSVAISGIYRAHGITLVPSLAILITALLNLALDPLLIFGLWGLPQMGIEGAGLATMISNLIAALFEIGIAKYKFKFFGQLKIGVLKDHLKNALRISAIAALSNALNPISLNLYNYFLSSESSVKVAGLGVATKIQFFSMVPILALSAAMGPIIGQNFGARNFGRIHKAFKYIVFISLGWGAVQFISLSLLSEKISELFSDKAAIVEYSSLYLTLVSGSFFGYSLVILAASCLNALNHPVKAFVLTVLRTLLLFGLFYWAFAQLSAPNPLLWAIALGNALSGLLSLWLLNKSIDTSQKEAT